MSFFSSTDDTDMSLSKQRTAIGSKKTGFFFSEATTRQTKVKIAVCDTSDRFFNLPFLHEAVLSVLVAALRCGSRQRAQRSWSVATAC